MTCTATMWQAWWALGSHNSLVSGCDAGAQSLTPRVSLYAGNNIQACHCHHSYPQCFRFKNTQRRLMHVMTGASKEHRGGMVCIETLFVLLSCSHLWPGVLQLCTF